MEDFVLAVHGLKVNFDTRLGTGKAVNGVSFALRSGETLGLVGESGSGKSATALAIVGLLPQPAARVVEGQVLFRGEDLLQKSHRELTEYRGKHIAMILQDPMTALNPVLTIGDQIHEPLRLHTSLRGASMRNKATSLLDLLRVPDAEDRQRDYPHQFSGGMRQRVVGAIAAAGAPELLIADEPTTSLDMTAQAAYLRLLKDLQQLTDMAMLFITHDLGIVARVCDRVAVMYAGRIIEIGPTEDVLTRPAHPYTAALLRAVPDVRYRQQELQSIEGHPPSIYRNSVGCPFAPRCAFVMDICESRMPPEREVAASHAARCWLNNE